MKTIDKQSLLIYGVGAFGEFILPYLQPYFDIYVYDKHKNLDHLNVSVLSDVKDIGSVDIVMLAVPVQYMEQTVEHISPYLVKGQLVMDVASVKVRPQEWLLTHAPDYVDLVGLHPLFGPKSGKYGIKGLNITACHIRGDRYNEICRFLSHDLQLNVTQCSAEDHDRDMAYVQGLTHIIAKSFSKMNVPNVLNKTQTYIDLVDMVNLIKDDSDELFRAIQNYNPYSKDVRERFFNRVKEVEKNLEG